jgi:tRNA threonylcarbamoyladenosine biosynthesis protein TsaE
VTLSEAQLRAWGEAIGAWVRPPAFFALSGELGAGKSVLARAIARGAGVEAVMPSPTFNLLFRYNAAGGTTVVHLDLYRLERPAQVWELGWRELGAADEIVLVEWPERAAGLLPQQRWDILLEHAGPEARRVSVTSCGGVAALPEAAA